MNVENDILAWKLTPHGKGLVINPLDLGHAATSLDVASKYLPGGAYTTLRTYSRTKVMRIEDHFQRLADSAQRANAGFYPRVTALRPVLRQILNLSPFPLTRIRVTLDLEIDPGSFYVTLEKLHTPPEEAYREGVRAITHRMQRENPKAKLTNFLATASELRSQLPQGVNEMLMVDHNGMILEGLSSNFYGVIAESIFTVEEGVLLGITRSAVLEIAVSMNIPVNFEGIHISQIESLDECFITSASRGVLPVVQIDDRLLGSGKPGPLSQKLILSFNLWVEKNVEEI